MKAALWRLIHKWRDATTTEAAWIARDQIDIELDKIEAAATQEPIGEVSGSDWSTALLWKDREPGSPVYAEAGATPVPRMTGAALASQEPVAEVLLVDGEKVIDASMAFFDSVELGTKLYLAAGAAPVPSELVLTFNFGTLVKVVFQDRVLYEVDLSPKSYWQVCWAHGWAGDYESEEEAREECLSLCGHGRSIREIKPGDDGYKNPHQPQLTEKRFLLAAAGAAPVPEGWRSAVAMAYGHLWHVNNEPMAPIPLRSEESASYAARKLLRDLMTTKERGEAINSVRAMLAAALKEPS